MEHTFVRVYSRRGELFEDVLICGSLRDIFIALRDDAVEDWLNDDHYELRSESGRMVEASTPGAMLLKMESAIDSLLKMAGEIE